MSGKRYPEEFKIEAVKQVTERGYKVSEVAQRLGVTSKSLGDWIKRYGGQSSQHQTISAQQEELRRLKAELRRVTEERDALVLEGVTFEFASDVHDTWVVNSVVELVRVLAQIEQARFGVEIENIFPVTAPDHAHRTGDTVPVHFRDHIAFALLGIGRTSHHRQ